MKEEEEGEEEGEEKGGVLLSETRSPSDTWLTAGDGRGESEYGTDRDPETHAQKERGSWPSAGRSPAILQLCWSQQTLLSSVRTSESTE